MQHIATPSLAADANESALDKLAKFLSHHSTYHPQQVDNRKIVAAKQVGGPMLARAHDVYLTWFHNYTDWASVCLFEEDWEKQAKSRHTYCSCGQFPYEHRVLLLSYGQEWNLSLDFKAQELRIMDECNENLIYPNENLEQLFVGHLLMQWFTLWNCTGIENVWLAPEVLNDSSQWELLWYRPAFVYEPCVYYQHVSGEMALIYAGQSKSNGTYLLIKNTCDFAKETLQQRIDAPQFEAKKNLRIEPSRQYEFCDRCMDF